MERILESVHPVVERSEHITINQRALEDFASTIQPEELETPEFFEKDDKLSLEQNIAFGFVYNAVNFSYWGDPKWTISVRDENYDGSIALLRAMQQAIDAGYDLLSAEYLRTIPTADLEAILQGNVEIPLFTERLSLIRELGEFIAKNYEGSFTAFVDKAQWDAVKLVEQLADEIPAVFNDQVDYHGMKVNFYKRAQLIPAHLRELYQLGVSPRDVTSMDQLTALADYKVPQLLRKYDIIQYSPDLADRIDNLVEIAAGSDEEIEIRVLTVWAVEQLAQHVKRRIPSVNPLKIDHILWLRGQEKSPDDKPYHRTRTIWY